jgi:CBS domain-containing protein
MQLKNLMTREVEVVDFNMTLQQAAAKMQSLNVGALPVREGMELVGMVTDRDIVIRAVADGRDPTFTSVAEVMTVELVYCYEDQTVEEAAKIMAEQQIRRLPVFDREHQLVGIVSLGDLAEDVGDDPLIGKTLEEISEPAMSFR